MKSILLTAGFGSRLRPLTNVLPKCLLPINGRPLLEYWFSMLRDAGIISMLMNLHYLADAMREWVMLTEYAHNIKMVYEEELLGTGGTLLRNRDFVGNEPVMLVHADNLCLTDIQRYIAAHANRPKGTEITMMTFNTPTPETCGIVEIDDSGIVRAFHEKVADPPGNLANAAVYIIEPAVIDFLASLNKPLVDFSTEVLPHYVETGKVYTYHNQIYHRDIGNMGSYLAAQIEFPQSATSKETNNAWSLICRRNSNKLDDKIISALSSTLNAELVDVDKLLQNKKNKSVNRAKICIMYCSDAGKHLEPVTRMIENEKLLTSNILIFFKKVPTNFSSRTLYEKTGLRSIALYSNDN
ncbi:MAG: nucleotidyltransferase family protein [Proteobacteria bacterium]|nr:nucleotidyltransferase family protein [Pseudomonadota bacterium]